MITFLKTLYKQNIDNMKKRKLYGKNRRFKNIISQRDIISLLSFILLSVILAVSNYHNSPRLIINGVDKIEYKTIRSGIYYIVLMDIIFIVIWVYLVLSRKIDIIYQYIRTKFVRYEFTPLISLFAMVFIFFTFLIGSTANTSFILFRSFFVFSLFFVILIIIYFKGKPEKSFLSISLIVGLMLSVTLPISLVSWDEEAHYPKAVEQSFSTISYFTEAENNIRSISIEEWFNSDTRNISIAEKNLQYRNGFYRFYRKNFKIHLLYNQLGYIPSGIMLFLARSFKFPFQIYFFFGRIGNVLVYSFVIYLALKRLKTGKYILSTIALFPTCVFLASNYSYDYWVTAFTALGTAYLLRELQEPDKKVEIKNICIMIGAFVIGFGPKAIYFPLMLMLYFLRKKKFVSQISYRKYLMLITLSLLFVIGSFLLPLFYSRGLIYSDLRGGSDVNSIEQIKFILSNPVSYIVTLVKFSRNYLSLENMRYYTILLGYLGNAPNFILLFIMLIIVIITDKNQYDEIASSPRIRLFLSGIVFISIALFATALYIAFTPIGANWIAGCQGRYIVPVLFPVLYVLGSPKVQNRINEKIYSVFIFGSLSYILFFGIWNVVISKYN
jgi:uncharacterized membrane protein